MGGMEQNQWKDAIERALASSGDDPSARWVQLATVGLDGAPSVRTVVFRGFVEGRTTLRFTTDLRSTKVAEIAREPRAEACWMFNERREQFRLCGTLRVIGSGDEGQDDRLETWRSLSPPSRSSFAWPEPGAERSDDARFQVPEPDPEQPLPTFALLLLEPEEVDHLDLRQAPHARTRFERIDRDGRSAWKPVAMNP